jgi:hypothetical protein
VHCADCGACPGCSNVHSGHHVGEDSALRMGEEHFKPHHGHPHHEHDHSAHGRHGTGHHLSRHFSYLTPNLRACMSVCCCCSPSTADNTAAGRPPCASHQVLPPRCVHQMNPFLSCVTVMRTTRTRTMRMGTSMATGRNTKCRSTAGMRRVRAINTMVRVQMYKLVATRHSYHSTDKHHTG